MWLDWAATVRVPTSLTNGIVRVGCVFSGREHRAVTPNLREGFGKEILLHCNQHAVNIILVTTISSIFIFIGRTPNQPSPTSTRAEISDPFAA